MSVVPVNQIKGFKYPDTYLIRFFYKYGLDLDKNKGRVLELGCSNGNNLSLFYEHGWNITGVDIDKTAITEAARLYSSGEFCLNDMLNYTSISNPYAYDVVLFQSSLYYLHAEDITQTLKNIKKNGYLRSGTLLSFRMRTPNDFRRTEANLIEGETYRISQSITGESDCTNTFYSPVEFVELLKSTIGIKDYKTLNINYQNIQKGITINNSDFSVWCSV